MAKGINPYSSKNQNRQPRETRQAPVDPVPSGTAVEILAWVDGDSERAQRALDVERENLKRKTVIRDLEKVVSQ